MMMLRHPITISYYGVIGLMIAVMGVWLRVHGWADGYVVLLLAALLGTGSETAYGRTRAVDRVRAEMGGGLVRPSLVRMGVMTAVSALSYLICSVALVPPEGFVLVWVYLPLVFCVSSVCYLAGTVVPFSDAAPASMVLTGVVGVVMETLVLLIQYYVVPAQTMAVILFDFLAALGACAASLQIARHRGPSMGA
jgi:hypothetical protein